MIFGSSERIIVWIIISEVTGWKGRWVGIIGRYYYSMRRL